MSLSIKVELLPESKAFISKFEDKSWVPQAVKRGMDRALSIVRGRIQENRLSGSGPFPPADHKLGERTQNYLRSVREEPAEVQGETITGAIGVGVIYGRIHELGGVIFPRRSPYLVFTIGEKTIRAKWVKMPARAPITTGITENLEYISTEIGTEIEKTYEKM